MSVSELSASSQNYLKAIWSLQEWSQEPVTASTLAARVGLKLSTVSDAIRKLTAQGLLEHAPYGSISLTATGHSYAVAMVRRHRLIETFLVQMLGYRWDQVHAEAETLEHAVSDFMVERIDELLGFPVRDPHGDPIPSADGTVNHPDVVLLTDLEPDHQARVERISDANPDLLQFFDKNGIGVGTSLQIRAREPFVGAVEVVISPAQNSIMLGRQATDSVWVTPAN